MKGSMAIVGVRLLAIWDFNDSSLFAFVAAHLKMLCSRSSIDVFFSGFYLSKLELTYLTYDVSTYYLVHVVENRFWDSALFWDL